MFEFITNCLPAVLTQPFRKARNEQLEEDYKLECAAERLARTRPLSSSLGARQRGGEISGHWTIRGQEIYLDYKYKNSGHIDKPEISQTISKALINTYRAS